jgi:hypothetical protein
MNSMQDVFKTWQDATLDTWSYAAKQVTSSESWFNALNAQMDLYLAGSKKLRQSVATSLEALDLPKKDDLVRLSVQALAAETRAAECEERLDQVEVELKASRDRLAELERRVAEMGKPAEKAVSASAKVIKSRRKQA